MRFTIKTKLGLSFGGLVTCLAASGAIGIVSLSASNDRMQEFTQRPFAQVQRVGSLQVDMINAARIMNRSLSQLKDTARAEDRRSFNETLADFDAIFSQYVERVPPEAREAVTAAVRKARAAYGAESEKTWALILNNNRNKAADLAYDRLERVTNPLLDAFLALQNTLQADRKEGNLASLAGFRLDFEAIRRIGLNIVLTSGDAAATTFVKERATILARATTELDAAIQGLNSEGAKQADKLRTAFQAYVDYDKDIIRLGTSDGDVEAVAMITTGSTTAARKVLQEELAKLKNYEGTVANEFVSETQARYELTRLMMLALVAGAVAAGLAMAFWISLSIARGLASSVRIAEAVADGDLTQEILADRQDEIGNLQRAMRSMVTKLREVVGQVSSAAVQVSTGSQELSASAEQLSEGSTEQAASTEEASASMEEMAANVKQNADNAGQTEVIARRSAADAEASGVAVGKAVDAMQTIAQKITIVQEIARQTDLLALNAAVEAARAGEHGRGFAVVASEVRKLAERSQTAATEIGALSGETVKAAQDAGAMLSKLVPDIRRTAELVEEITAACREQDVGSTQINQAIQQLDRVTQQNAAASEEVSATSEELSAQAEQLQASIAFFRTEQGAAVSAAPVAIETPAAPRPVAALQRRAAEGAKAIRSPKAGPAQPARATKAAGGFAFDMAEAGDAQDGDFRRAS